MSEQGDERGFHLTEAEQRYRELFGGPSFRLGPARNPYTPGVRIVDAPNDLRDRSSLLPPARTRRDPP